MIPLFIPHTIAQTDPMIPGSWLTTFVVAVIGALGAVWMKQKGRQQGRAENVTLNSPIPTVPTLKIVTPPSWDQHKALADRVATLEERLTIQERIQSERFIKLMEAGEARKDAILDKFSHDIADVYQRINQIADVIRPNNLPRRKP